MKERKLNGETVFKGKILTLNVDEIETDTGAFGTREYVVHGGGAAALAVEDGKVLLERQYRYPYDEIVWEIPAGKRENGEDFEVTARREFEEETGLKPLAMKKIACIYPTPGYTNEKIGIYFVEKFEKGKLNLDECEDIEISWIPLEKAYEMIENGAITDAKTLVALLWYKGRGE